MVVRKFIKSTKWNTVPNVCVDEGTRLHHQDKASYTMCHCLIVGAFVPHRIYQRVFKGIVEQQYVALFVQLLGQLVAGHEFVDAIA
jgi:hypothetical protein